LFHHRHFFLLFLSKMSRSIKKNNFANSVNAIQQFLSLTLSVLLLFSFFFILYYDKWDFFHFQRHIENEEEEREQIIDILHTFSFSFSPSTNAYINSIGVKKKQKKNDWQFRLRRNKNVLIWIWELNSLKIISNFRFLLYIDRVTKLSMSIWL